jgi:hypothetical protein
MTTAQPEPVQMIEDCRQALQGLRRALIDLYSSVGQDPTQPQQVSRQLGLNRNLTWKLAKIVEAHDPFATLNHLPGQQGMELTIAAFTKAGAAPAAVAAVESALAHFDRVIEHHAEDRDHLELTLESMGLYARETKFESGRELAYRGTSMIWGVQTRTRLHCAMLAPSRGDPSKLDFAQLGGLIGFRRLRSSVTWRLYRQQVHNDKGSLISQPQPLEPTMPGDPPLMMRSFCSPNLPAIQTVPGPEGIEFFLPGGQVGNQATFDYVTGFSIRGLTRYRTDSDQFASTAAGITVPTETLVMDLLVHRDIARVNELESSVYGFPHGGLDAPTAQTISNKLPIKANIMELAGTPPAIATPRFPRYRELVDTVYRHMDWNPADFRGYRLMLEFVPMSSRVVMRWPLADAPH